MDNAEDQDFNGRIRNLELEREKLLVALHDAINRPMGVVPDSAMEFYDPQHNKPPRASWREIGVGLFGIKEWPGSKK